jgi:DNA-binding NarL/FixJ family response regulator
VGDADLAVVSFPVAAPSVLGRLSPAERSVALLACAGLQNRDIARRRGSAERTVANQLASTFRKLGIASRAELAVLLAAAPRSWGNGG